MSIPDDTQATHSAECWKWHLECAGREVERLRAEVDLWKQRAETAWAKGDEEAGTRLRLVAENERLRAEVEHLRAEVKFLAGDVNG